MGNFACSQDVKEPNVAGQFYPDNKEFLSCQIDDFLAQANPEKIKSGIFCLLSPHAGYEFSGAVAAEGYRLIQNRPYNTVVIMGPAHYYGFSGISVYAQGKFRTPLGLLEVDSVFARKIISPDKNINFLKEAFDKEHSVEVQLPFLQKALSDFKIVPVVVGNCDFKVLRDFADNLAKAIGSRKDVLLVASSDLYHGYDYEEARAADNRTLSNIEKMSGAFIYEKIKFSEIQMCGGFPFVCAVLASEALGYKTLKILKYTNSAQVTGRKIKGQWTVGYVSGVIDNSGEPSLESRAPNLELNSRQKKKLLKFARQVIIEYLTTGKRLEAKDADPKLNEINGVFVTLREGDRLRGCIGNITGRKPLIETVRDMAIESATADSRFEPVKKEELKNIEIEISVLSPLEKINDIADFKLSVHGAVVRKAGRSGVFLPQVAEETGWDKEEFLSNLCSQKAGLPQDAWKDPQKQIFIFSALVFSEKEK